MQRKDIVIVTPALADANNGNLQTAGQWTRMLRRSHSVRLAAAWDGGDEAQSPRCRALVDAEFTWCGQRGALRLWPL